MSKNTKKRNKYNQQIISTLRDRHGLTVQFIYLSLAGHRTSDTALKLKKEYKELNSQIQKILNTEHHV